ncbi:hypothetical protein [Vibrio apostichopi]|uniref:hypothetical protein n=1 Tax=Vibrio apostichopi TaxID=3035453 RepID=UPI0025733925|nr:hypothetical protein [Vibrio sp. FE10]
MQMPSATTLSRWLSKGSIATVLITCASWSTVSAANDQFEGIPGERTCFFRLGPVSADPFINVAYPDAAVKYWGATFTVPDDAKLRLEGQFPHSRYMSLISYDDHGRPLQSLPDYMIKPNQSSVNPFREGNQRDSVLRSYQVKILDSQPKTDYTAGQVRDGLEMDELHAPRSLANQQTLIYRIYAKDENSDGTGDASLPEPVLTLASGKELRGQEACDAMNSAQPLKAKINALGIPVDKYRELVSQPNKPVGFPATNPSTWHIQLDRESLLGIYTGKINPEARRSTGGFYPNLDNNYIRTVVNRKHGPVYVLRAKAPVTPKTIDGDKEMTAGELRYWSVCSNQGFAVTKVNDCLHDENIPVDKDGYYTVVVSRAADRPRNAFAQCGVGWLPMSDNGDGIIDEDASIVQIRHMLASPKFTHAIQNIPQDKDIAPVMGEYYPRTFYTTTNKFELMLPCMEG